MKKSILALIGAVVVIGSLFTGCKKDTTANVAPTVVISKPAGGEITVEPNGTVPTSVLASAANGSTLKTWKVEVSQDNGPFTPLKDSTFKSSTTSYTYESTLGSKSTVGDLAYRFTVTDDKSLSGSATLTIHVKKSTVGNPINTYSAKLLGNQSSATGSFFGSATGTVYTQTNAKANASAIDFLYFHASNDGPTIAAPNDANAATMYSNPNTGLQTWSVRNATLLYTSTKTATDFDAITDDAAIIAANTGTSATRMIQLTTGKVFAFTTVAGKKGLVKVTNITGSSTASGEITIDVKVQQ